MLRATLGLLKPRDTLVIYKPDRVARSMKELLVLLEDELHARDINLHILSGICAGLHRPNAANIADKMLFMVAAMAAEMERDLIRERTRDGLAAAAAQGRTGGRPAALNPDDLAVAQARRAGRVGHRDRRALEGGAFHAVLGTATGQRPGRRVVGPGRAADAGQGVRAGRHPCSGAGWFAAGPGAGTPAARATGRPA